MAHKKAAGSAKNLRDSQPKYRGVKLFGGQKALAGNIIIRQKGSQYECGENTYLAADFTIHALIDGKVVFKKKNFKRFDGRTYLKTVVTILPELPTTAPQVPTKKTVTKTADKAPKAAEKAETTVVTEPQEESTPSTTTKTPKKASTKK
ncbi:MAG: bL27 family ribosomal protein [Candidatus Peribacteria bacterium]|jgi:large subunit ribosomal protein L27|nr:bL27 family ribosomal protein [Candidatus Peribacteria bacterium]